DAVVTGRVVSGSMVPASGADVSIPSLGLATFTNDLGNYRLVVPAAQATGQTVTIRVAMIGYEAVEATVQVSAGATVRRDFTINERAIALDEIVVTGVVGQLQRRAQSAVVGSVNAAQVSEV